MMSNFNTLAKSAEMAPFVDFTRKCQESPELRARAEADARAVLSEHGIPMPPDRDVRIVANTAETFNLIMPPDPNEVLADEDLATVAGGIGFGPKCSFCLISTISTMS